MGARRPLKLHGPDRFELRFDPSRVRVLHAGGARTFSGLAAKPTPKLYVVLAGTRPVYVGVTRRPLAGRLRSGFAARGESGYYGYPWRHGLSAATLLVWYAFSDSGRVSATELETIEAEVVFGIRQRGQWPTFQTEIHFHQSTAAHRRLARVMLDACLDSRL